jgi:serine/tyrosine/threonine adenylyltransferase
MTAREDLMSNEGASLGPEAGSLGPDGWRLQHSYMELPQLFYSRIAPTSVREPQLVIFNTALAKQLGLDADSLNSAAGAAIFAGNALPHGAQPIAQAYAGHQFGHFTGLGDGRAILLGEQVTPSGERVDVQLKGAGQTPYSRRGDGRAALGPMLREYIISEALHALGIPTTRSLAVVTTGEPVYREEVLQGAVLTRVAASHIRVGTMEWAAAHRDDAALRALSDYTRTRHYPELADDEDAHFALFTAIIERLARLLAQWQLVGFIHGVMNTDNMALSGETIDFGPCAFMDAYHPETVFSSIDTGGRYAYGNQPAVAQWNLARLAEAMLPLFVPRAETATFGGHPPAERSNRAQSGEAADSGGYPPADRSERVQEANSANQARAVERATEALHRFAARFEQHWNAGMRAKLGLFEEQPGDTDLANDLFTWMQRTSADFTNTFRTITTSAHGEDIERTRAFAPVRADADFAAWLERLHARWQSQSQSRDEVAASMRRSNPAFVPRNHKVEEALAAATSGDVSVMQRLLDVLAAPYDHDRVAPEYTEPGTSSVPYRTFCGT